MISTRSLPAPTEDAPSSKETRFGLSWTQIAAAGFASITATVVLSFFSISGTLIGAAVFSMVTAIGNAVYNQSLRTTQSRVLDVLPVLPVGKADPASPTVVLPVSEPAGADDEDLDGEPVLPAARPLPGPGIAPVSPAAFSRRAWKRIAILAVALFVFVMAVVTTIELLFGRPLTDILRGDNGSGTSIGGGGRAPAPTVTVTVTPSVVMVTPTVTQTATPTTATTTPSTTATTPSTTTPGSGSTTPSDGGTATSGTPSTTGSSSP